MDTCKVTKELNQYTQHMVDYKWKEKLKHTNYKFKWSYTIRITKMISLYYYDYIDMLTNIIDNWENLTTDDIAIVDDEGDTTSMLKSIG